MKKLNNRRGGKKDRLAFQIQDDVLDVIGETETIVNPLAVMRRTRRQLMLYLKFRKSKAGSGRSDRRCDRYFTRTSIRKSIFDRTFTMDGASR